MSQNIKTAKIGMSFGPHLHCACCDRPTTELVSTLKHPNVAAFVHGVSGKADSLYDELIEEGWTVAYICLDCRTSGGPRPSA